jgi:ribosomal subunit interface protein
MIPITFKATGAVMLTDEVRSYVEDKLRKIEKVTDKNDSTLRADIELGTTGGARTGEQYRVEINLKFSGGFARAEATRETLHTAIDEAVEEIRGEVRKSVTKHRDLVRRGAAKVKDIFRYWSGK